MCNIIAGIVLYNPDFERLHENIINIIEQVDKLILIDNNSNNIREIEESISCYKNITLIRNSKNLGIASALNQIIRYAKENSCDWALTLDQDSVCQEGLIEEYKKYLNVKTIGMMTCLIGDRNRLDSERSNEDAYEYVERCITSGSLTNVEACLEVGAFDEAMFIDYVDYDMCALLRERGYKILKVNFYGLLHELGNIVNKKLFSKEVVVYNHAPFRVYYYARNLIYYMRKHRKVINHKIEYKILAYKIITIVLYEKQKFKKIYNMVRGMCDGLKMEVNLNKGMK